MHSPKKETLATIAGVLAVGDFVSAVIIAVENYRDSFPAGAAVFGVLFLVGVWLLRRQRVIAGAIFIGLLCLFEVVSYPAWARHSVLDSVFDTTFALVALAGLATAIAVLVARRRSPAVTI